ncbi:MAG: DUF3850 domain-containing protein [Elsteraceae bacterium]
MTKTHKLYLLQAIWDAIAAKEITWLTWTSDRMFQRGDVVELCRYAEKTFGKQQPDPMKFRVGWMLQGGQCGIEPGYCVFSLDPIEPAKTLYWADLDGEWVFTENRSDLLDDLPLAKISPAIHSNVEPHLQWAVRVPIETDGEGFVLDDELRWFNTYRDAEDCVDYINGPGETVEPALAGDAGADQEREAA